MTIWDEKPKVHEYNEGYSGYDEKEMDAWLEKVKAEGDELQTYNKLLDNVYTEACGEIVELQMKLEGIKDYLNKLRSTGKFIDKQMIMNIIES